MVDKAVGGWDSYLSELPFLSNMFTFLLASNLMIRMMRTRPNYLVSVSSRALFADLFCQISAREAQTMKPRCKPESSKFFMGGFKAMRG